MDSVHIRFQRNSKAAAWHTKQADIKPSVDDAPPFLYFEARLSIFWFTELGRECFLKRID